MRKLPPTDIPGKLRFTGVELFGACWRGRLAAGLGVSRTTLRAWMLGLSKSDRDIDSELIFLVDKERAATGGRAAELTALRSDLIAAKRTADVD